MYLLAKPKKKNDAGDMKKFVENIKTQGKSEISGSPSRPLSSLLMRLRNKTRRVFWGLFSSE